MGEKEGLHAKAKFRCKVTPGTLSTFLATYSLHNRLLEIPSLFGDVISTILEKFSTLNGYSLLKLTGYSNQ